MTGRLYAAADFERPLSDEKQGLAAEPYRTPFRRDAARVLHSACFRRLQGKTQLFPSSASDFVRTRLTHSLEVGQIARSIAIRLNHENQEWVRDVGEIDADLCELAGWCHDLGHPPFGHAGEYELNRLHQKHGGFEGNAQTLRLLSRLEKKFKGAGSSASGLVGGQDARYGLNLTYRTLAAVLKYDREIPHHRDKSNTEFLKGYYEDEQDLVADITRHVLPDGAAADLPFKTIECSIMDVADDIAYSTYDLEDAFKSGFLTPAGVLALADNVAESVATKVLKALQEMGFKDIRVDARDVQDVLHEAFKAVVRTSKDPTPAQQRSNFVDSVRTSQEIAAGSYGRTNFTSSLVGSAVRGTSLSVNEAAPVLSKVHVEADTLIRIEVLKHVTYELMVRTPTIRAQQERASVVLGKLYAAFAEGNHATELLPPDVAELQRKAKGLLANRVVVDYIASMTDRYAAEYYERLTSPRSIHLFKRPH